MFRRDLESPSCLSKAMAVTEDVQVQVQASYVVQYLQPFHCCLTGGLSVVTLASVCDRVEMKAQYHPNTQELQP